MIVSMNKKHSYRILMFSIFMFCGVISVYSQNPQLGTQTLLQQLLNYLPAIPIAGNNLKFQFGGDTWIANLNGKNFLAGILTIHNVDERGILILKQTHTYVALGWVNTHGPDIILEYKEGPPASLRAISRSELPEELATTLDDDTNVNTDIAPSQDSQSVRKQGSILAIIGIGGQFFLDDYDPDYVRYYYYGYEYWERAATTLGVNILFIGNFGFTISSGIDSIFKSGGYLSIDPIFGFGYIYKKSFYVGGILNAVFKLRQDGYITPTLVFGCDFGGFLLGGQFSLMFGVVNHGFGLKFSLGAGVSLM